LNFEATKQQNQPLGMKKIIKSEITKILDKVPLAKNLARKKFISDFTLGLIESRKVQFQEVALHIESEAKTESVERKIQAFFKEYEFDYEQVCMLLTLFLPRKKVNLSIDRTEWDFGSYQCNILMIVAKNDTMGIPLCWLLLDNNSGNSHSTDRCRLMSVLLKVIGKERIGLITGDREFIGIGWLKYLKDNNILFVCVCPRAI
jgi:hypothetical protein